MGADLGMIETTEGVRVSCMNSRLLAQGRHRKFLPEEKLIFVWKQYSASGSVFNARRPQLRHDQLAGVPGDEL